MSSTSSSAALRWARRVTPKPISGRPSSLTVTAGARLPKNCFAICRSFCAEVVIDSAMALASAVTNAASLSVGQRSTYAATVCFFGNRARTLLISEVFPKRRSEKTNSFSRFRIAFRKSAFSFWRLQNLSPLTTPPYSKGFLVLRRTLNRCSGAFRRQIPTGRTADSPRSSRVGLS